MGLKYFSRYRDFNGKIRQVRFSKEGFDGTPIEWKNSLGAVRYTWGSSDSFFPEQPIVAGQAQIALIFEERYDLSDLVINRKNYYVEVQEEDTGDFIWSGWLEPWDASHSYQKPPYQVNMTASCGLAHLSRKKYLTPDSTFKRSGLQIIRDCLGIIGRANLPIRVSAHMLENGFDGDEIRGLESFEENTFRYFDQNGEAMYCDIIVNNILEHFNAEIVQYRNVWTIRAIVDHATGADTRFFNLGDTTIIEEWPLEYVINADQAKSLNGGNIRTLPPINKYRTEIDFGQQKPFFENGNMLIWNDSGLVGWDFSHMPKGNPGWERYEIGAEVSRGVLKINGKSPQPYRKKKKKKFGQILVPILTGMIGANLKNTYYDVEPAQYIESPGGTIGRGDKSVTITFDYETEAFSSDILISIRIPRRNSNGTYTDFWVDPSMHPALAGADKSTAGASENFKLIRVEPVDRGALTDKGTIDVSGNPNYPVANFSPGSQNQNWTWTVAGVPDGEFRRIGGANGVIVENGDLIIARVANLGGTQEEVGEFWEVVSLRNDTKRGTFSLSVALNTMFITGPGQEFTGDKIYVRFYKMADDGGKPGDWYKVYNLDGKLAGFVASDESSKYATTLERGDVTDEEAATINLISGDFTPWYAGAWTRPGSNTMTSSWRRRPALSESMSIYRAMMKDRLCMTTKSLSVVEGKTQLAGGQPDIHYLHKLYFADQDKHFRQVRFSFTDATREFDSTSVEIKYEEIPDSELKQNSYIPGSRTLNTVPGMGDGIYPSKEDSTSGRLNAEDMPLTEEELIEQIEATARLDALFENITPLTYVAAIESEDSVDLKDFLSETFVANNENQEEDDYFDITTLVLKLAFAPPWFSTVEEDELVVTATALAPKSGQYYIDFTATDPESGFSVPIRVPVLVEENEDYVETWPPEFDLFPVLNFVLDKPTTTGFDFRDYITSGHKKLQYRFFSVPEWITARSVVNDDFSITGTPTIIEKRKITVEIWDGIAEHRPYTDEITLQVIEATEITGKLIGSKGGEAVTGDLPGAFEVLDKWDALLTVTGLHDKITIKVTGGGDLGNEVDFENTLTLPDPVAAGTYRPFIETGGVDGIVGQYSIEITAFLGENETAQSFDLMLYDDEYLAKMRKYLTKGVDRVGEIMPDGSTSFLYPGEANVRAEIHDIDFDEIYISLEKEGSLVGEQHLTDVDPITTWWFYALEEDAELSAGVYTFPVRLLKDGVEVFKRTDKFTIESKDAEPLPLLSLATFAAGTTNANDLAENIPLKGAEYDLPSNYTVIFNGFGGVAYSLVEAKFEFLRDGGFAEVDIQQYTGYPQITTYPQPVTSGKVLIFGNKSSLKIGDIHQAPSRVRATFNGKDQAGKIVGIAQADFSFRIALDPEDYSGFAFFEDDIASGAGNLIDGNMPRENRKYLLPATGKTWSVRRKSFEGMPFEYVSVTVGKRVSGVWQDYGNVIYFPEPTTGVDDFETIRSEWELSDNRPIVKNSVQPIYIDEPGEYRVIMSINVEGINHGRQTTFELIEDVEPPIKDCCACDCEGEGSEQIEYPFMTPAEEWIVAHNLNKKPDPLILIGGKKVLSDVQYLDNDVFKVIHSKPQTGSVIIIS
ncbi:hypothetical protein [Dyadobacter fermentans]|uniref:Uncharacterized protein n=1 Tax=Dyadobacter fermentans (strain ATCC 700827 / DSM 18053 / CIP 107007 / KCTC 52180 / NS114) TaxID=471854 RepID=C6VVH9_DYAFD|nr:hypothetical protein [Dyadobacter fermentans]ACT96709.1 hypothetical protein Dfer_5518 [Dyadobacter fermentans DSM 18053]